MVRAEGVSCPLPEVLGGGALWISLCWMFANCHDRGARSDWKEDRRPEGDNFVTWHDAAGHICHCWGHSRTQ